MDAYNRALRLLAMREHGRVELERKLVEKGYEKDEIQKALDSLEDENYLSDERFCISYIRSRLRKNPEGQNLIVMRLVEKGISPSLARSVTSDYFSDHEEEIEALYADYRERLISAKGEEKALATLYRKGIRVRG